MSGTPTNVTGFTGNGVYMVGGNGDSYSNSAAALDFSGNHSFIFSIKPDVDTAAHRACFSRGAAFDWALLAYRDNAGDGLTSTFTWRQYRAGGGSDEIAITVTNGSWNHVAVTYGGGTLKGYVNGVEVASGATSGTPATGKGDTYINRDFLFTNGNAVYDNFGAFNVKLLAAEVSAIYAGGVLKTWTHGGGWA